MATESGNGFTHRYRFAIALGGSVAVIALLVLAYQATAPQSAENTTGSGNRISESEVLQVGALPVT
jgi:hypothetical protein